MAKWIKQFLCLHAWWNEHTDYSECLKCGRLLHDTEVINARGREIHDRVEDLFYRTGQLKRSYMKVLPVKKREDFSCRAWKIE